MGKFRGYLEVKQTLFCNGLHISRVKESVVSS